MFDTKRITFSTQHMSFHFTLQLLILLIKSNTKWLVSTCNLIPVVSRPTLNRQQSTKKMLITSLQLEDKTQRLDVQHFFVLIVGHCYFTGLAIRNTSKIWKQPNYYGHYLKAKEKLWKHRSYSLSLCRIYGGGLAKKKRSRSSSQAFSALGLASKQHLVFYLLVKCRIKNLRYHSSGHQDC